MSNQFQTVASGSGVLKNWYQGPLVTQFNDEVAVWGQTQKGKFKWDGLQVNRPLKVRRNQGIGAVADGGPLPAIGRQGTTQAIIASAYNYLRFGVTGPMLKASQTDKGSFVRIASFELSEGYLDLKSDLNRQLGYNGNPWLARLNANALGSATIVIKGRENGEAALKFLDVSKVVDIYSSAGVLKAQAVTINSITSGGPNSSTATLVLSAAVTADENDYLISSGSYGNEMQGILTQQDGLTTTIYTNLNRSLYPVLQGNLIDLSGAQLKLNDMQNAFDEAERRGGMELSNIMCDYSYRRMYIKLLSADKRYVNTLEGKGGWALKGKSYLDFNGLPVIADKDMPPTMLFSNEKHFEKYVLCEMEFADESNANGMIAQVGTDAYEVRVRFFGNFFNSKAAGCARITGATSP